MQARQLEVVALEALPPRPPGRILTGDPKDMARELVRDAPRRRQGDLRGAAMAGAFWCVVEDDRQGRPKKVSAELIGEARRWAAELGGGVEAVWLTDKAAPEGLGQLAAWGADRVWLWEDAALAPYRGEVWMPAWPSWPARSRRARSGAP